MKITYLANIRLPTEKAHGLQIMKTCEAFVQEGASVTLVVPRRRNWLTDDPFTYYGIATRFPIVYLPTLDWVRFGRVGFIVQTLSYSVSAFWYCFTNTSDVVFSRDELPLWVASFIAKKTVWESHTGAWNFVARSIARRCTKLVAISGGIKNLYAKRGIDTSKIIVAPDGVELAAFANTEPTVAARQRLGLPQDKKVAMYIGRLDGWKGAATLLEASNLLPSNILVAIIGGEEAQVAAMRHKYPKAHFLGYHPYAEVANNQAAANVLVLPNTAKDTISAELTSPLKLFTYMASGKPIVASDLPSIREVLSNDACYFAKPDDAHSFAVQIQAACTNSEEVALKASAALGLVQEYSWQKRAQKILVNI